MPSAGTSGKSRNPNRADVSFRVDDEVMSQLLCISLLIPKYLVVLIQT